MSLTIGISGLAALFRPLHNRTVNSGGAGQVPRSGLVATFDTRLIDSSVGNPFNGGYDA